MVGLQDWALLHHEAGLQTFMAIPIIAQGATHGVLELYSSKAEAFKEPWWVDTAVTLQKLLSCLQLML